MARESYEFLYEYARQAIDEELKRFEVFEAKASRLGALLTVLIAGLTGGLRFAPVEFFPPQRPIDWAICVLAGFTYLAMASAWGQVLGSLKVIYAPRMPLTTEVIDMIRSNNLSSSKYALAQTCKNVLTESRKVIKSKADALSIAYNDTALSAWLLSATFIAMLVKAAFFNVGD